MNNSRSITRSAGFIAASLLFGANLGIGSWDAPAFRIQAPRRYRSPDIPRNDAGHLAAAEAKRQRKAAKKERDLARQTPTT